MLHAPNRWRNDSPLTSAALQREARATALLHQWMSQALQTMFSRWREYLQSRREAKSTASRFIKRMTNKELYAGFGKWVAVFQEQQHAVARGSAARAAMAEGGIGTVMLKGVADSRESNVFAVHDLLTNLASVQVELAQSQATTSQLKAQKRMEEALAEATKPKWRDIEPGFDTPEEQEEYRRQLQHTKGLLQQAESYERLGQLGQAEAAFQRYIPLATDARDAHGLVSVSGLVNVWRCTGSFADAQGLMGLARTKEAQKDVFKAIVYYERAYDVAKHVENVRQRGMCLEGIARNLRLRGQTRYVQYQV